MVSNTGANYQLKINKTFAAKYEKSKDRQELQRLQQKYGDSQATSESSSSESEDENAEALTPQIEKEFLKTLSLIKCKDPKIYDQSTSFYKDEDQNTSATIAKSESKKPLFLKDYERQRLLEKGVKALLSDSESDQEEDRAKRSKSDDLTYVEEQKQLKESFKTALEEESDDDDDDDDNFLQLRQKTRDQKKIEEQDYKEWLSSAKVPQKDPVNEIWSKSDLGEDEKFLRDYILNREYHDKDQDMIPSYSKIVNDIDSEDDPIENQQEFERKFNFRYEEPDEDFIKRYPRTIKESTRRVDEKRKKKRQEREERKDKEKEAKIEEIKKLKNLKRKEIMEKIERLKEITGNSKVGFLEEDLEGDFDPSKYDDVMKNVYDNEYYKADEEEDEKPVFSDSEGSQENWDEWEGNYDYANEADEEFNSEYHCEDPDFNMDADYIPTAKSQKKNSENRKRSKLAQVLKEKKPVFNPEDKTFEEYFDEYYKLDYEDIIGDLPVRFKYREVLPNNFGLSTDEILKAEDKELNQWCSLRKPMSYNTKEEEWRERLRYKKKARNSQKKARVFPSLFTAQGATTSINSEEESIANLDSEENVTNKKSKKVREISKKHITSSGVDKFKGIRSKWKRDSNLQSDDLRKRKKMSNSFKDAKKGFVTKLSSSRLAAYGIDTKRKKRKVSQKS